MKIFPESIVPDPDKEINSNDKNIIDRILNSVLKTTPTIKMITQNHVKNLRWSYAREMLECYFEDKSDKFKIEFLKISLHDKNTYFDFLQIVNSYISCVNPDDTDVVQKAKKLCGLEFRISDKEKNYFKSQGLAVGSIDKIYGDPEISFKLYKNAEENINLYIDWILKNLKNR